MQKSQQQPEKSQETPKAGQGTKREALAEALRRNLQRRKQAKKGNIPAGNQG